MPGAEASRVSIFQNKLRLTPLVELKAEEVNSLIMNAPQMGQTTFEAKTSQIRQDILLYLRVCKMNCVKRSGQ